MQRNLNSLFWWITPIDTLVNDYITEYSEKKTTNQTERKIRNIIRNDPERA